MGSRPCPACNRVPLRLAVSKVPVQKSKPDTTDSVAAGGANCRTGAGQRMATLTCKKHKSFEKHTHGSVKVAWLLLAATGPCLLLSCPYVCWDVPSCPEL